MSVAKLKNLLYLDDRPVDEQERKSTDAWSVHAAACTNSSTTGSTLQHARSFKHV